MKTLTVILCASLIALPLHAQEEPEVKAQFGVQCGIALLIVAVVGTSIYVIKKCEKVSEDICHNCEATVPADSTACPTCGTAYRCEDCNTELPEDAEFCPTCGTKVPEPVRPANTVQMSPNGTDWGTIVPPSGSVFSGLSIQSFQTEEQFRQWLGDQPDVVDVTGVAAPHGSGLFRLASQ